MRRILLLLGIGSIMSLLMALACMFIGTGTHAAGAASSSDRATGTGSAGPASATVACGSRNASCSAAGIQPCATDGQNDCDASSQSNDGRDA